MIGDRPQDSCIGVPIGTTVTERIVAKVACTTVTMYDLQMIGSSGMIFSAMSRVSGTTDQYTVTLTWTPTAAHRGPNVVCARAIDSTYLSSDLYCFTLLAGILAPSVLPSTISPKGVLSAATLAGTNGMITWSVKFDQAILRPKKNRYITIYKSDGTQLFQLDVSIFPTVNYQNDTITFETTNSFDAGSYYITLGYGVGVGALYCNAESDSMTSNTFWTFTVQAGTTTTTATTAQATTPNLSGVVVTGASSTASPILPVGVTTTTTQSTTTANTASTSSASSTTTISNAAGSTTTSISSSLSSGSTTVTASTTSTGSTTTISITPYRTISKSNQTFTQCSKESFILMNAIMLGAGAIVNVGSLCAMFYFYKI